MISRCFPLFILLQEFKFNMALTDHEIYKLKYNISDYNVTQVNSTTFLQEILYNNGSAYSIFWTPDVTTGNAIKSTINLTKNSIREWVVAARDPVKVFDKIEENLKLPEGDGSTFNLNYFAYVVGFSLTVTVIGILAVVLLVRKRKRPAIHQSIYYSRRRPEKRNENN